MVGHNSKYTYNLYKSFVNEVLSNLLVNVATLQNWEKKTTLFTYSFTYLNAYKGEAVVVGYNSMSIDGF